jgi:hypothetical protein
MNELARHYPDAAGRSAARLTPVADEVSYYYADQSEETHLPS